MANRSTSAKRGWSQRESKRVKLIDHIVTVQVDSPRGGGLPPKTTTRDFIVPARPGTRKTELLWLIQHRRSDDLLARERYAIGLTKVPGRRITIAEGPHTRGRKVKLR